MSEQIVTALFFLMLAPIGLYVFFTISKFLDVWLLNSQIKSAKKHIADYEKAVIEIMNKHNCYDEEKLKQKVKQFSDGIYATIYKK